MEAIIYGEGKRYQVIWECWNPTDERHLLRDTKKNKTILSYLDVKPVPIRAQIKIARRLNAYERLLNK